MIACGIGLLESSNQVPNGVNDNQIEVNLSLLNKPGMTLKLQDF